MRLDFGEPNIYGLSKKERIERLERQVDELREEINKMAMSQQTVDK